MTLHVRWLIQVTSRHVTSRHVTSRHVTSRHVTSRHVTCQLISFKITKCEMGEVTGGRANEIEQRHFRISASSRKKGSIEKRTTISKYRLTLRSKVQWRKYSVSFCPRRAAIVAFFYYKQPFANTSCSQKAKYGSRV